MSVEQVANGVRGLARLHSAFLGRPARPPTRHSTGSSRSSRSRECEYAPLHIAHERLGDTVPAEILALTGDRAVHRHLGPLHRDADARPQTLLHGDPHIGNTYVLPDDEVGFLDWQMVRRGNWSLDLGYFLQGAFTIEDRRRSERELLDEYRGALDVARRRDADRRRGAGCATARPSHTGWRSGWRRSRAATPGSARTSAWRSRSGTPRPSSTSRRASALDAIDD